MRIGPLGQFNNSVLRFRLEIALGFPEQEAVLIELVLVVTTQSDEEDEVTACRWRLDYSALAPDSVSIKCAWWLKEISHFSSAERLQPFEGARTLLIRGRQLHSPDIIR